MEIYRGPSMIDGNQIVAISTKSENRKTGDMMQVWILSADMHPFEAIKTGNDRSICGDCKHRGSTCYVAVHQAPTSIFHAWKRGKYALASDYSHFRGYNVRFGAYGDPAALPIGVIEAIAQEAKGHTGYTHQWKLPHAQPYKAYLMASVDSLAEYREAKAMGWRTFRIKNADEGKLKQEIVCPASEEAGKKSSCDKCGLCSGIEGKGKKDIVINVHGLPFKQERFKRLSLQLAA